MSTKKEKNGQPNVDDDGNGFVDDIYGYNFVTAKDVVGGTIEPDDGGHGTHVAGTVAARNNNGKGVAGIAGGDGSADSGVRLLSVRYSETKTSRAMRQLPLSMLLTTGLSFVRTLGATRQQQASPPCLNY